MDDFGKHMIEGFRERNPFRLLYDLNQPRIDVYQTDSDVIVKAEIPGVSKEDLNVYVDDNSIRFSGQSRRREEFKDENIYRSERSFGRFSRAIPLPVEIKSEQAKAEYQDGILSIIAPKTESAKTRGKRIEIQ